MESEPGPNPPATTESSAFSDAVATTSFNSFYNTFFSSTVQLFYSTTQRTTIAPGWTQAVFFDIAVYNYMRTAKAEDLQKIKNIYAGAFNAYSGFNWEKVKTVNGFIYDDMMWWVVSLARAYKVTHEPEYLQVAKAGFDFIWNESYDSINGGMKWSWKVEGKNACINYPTVIAAMLLYNISNEPSYLDKAKNIYSWARANLYQQSTGRVADHKVGNDPAGFEDYTYNQGTCIGAAVMLYQATKENSYLSDANAAAEYTKNVMSYLGYLPAEGDWNEQGVLKAIFAEYIYMLIYDAGQDTYIPWIKQNIDAAWKYRDKMRTLMYRDYTVFCPAGTLQSYEASSGVAFMQIFAGKFK